MKFFANMFEAWFKRKFDTKCKQNIDLTLMRIEIIKRRRNAMQKYLRSDIAELLRIGHVSDAYGRAERLYLDHIRTLCYDFVARYCTFILDQLTNINDQSECPEECKEAVSSLIYAAARFGDLPELRKLRSLFTERYEKSFESLVNKEFASLLKPDRPTKDMKVQLMKEIAQEHGVEWDPESLDNKLDKPHSFQHDWSANVGDDQAKEPRIIDHENGWMINIQETMNDDSNARKKNESNDDKQTENMRQRIRDYLSRTSSLFSTSRETSTSPEQSSISSDTSFDSPTNNGIEDVSDHPNVEKREAEKVVVTPRTVSNRWWRKSGALPRGKLHPAECLPKPVTANGPTRYVHPKLPDYDEIKAWFAAHRLKS